MPGSPHQQAHESFVALIRVGGGMLYLFIAATWLIIALWTWALCIAAKGN